MKSCHGNAEITACSPLSFLYALNGSETKEDQPKVRLFFNRPYYYVN